MRFRSEGLMQREITKLLNRVGCEITHKIKEATFNFETLFTSEL